MRKTKTEKALRKRLDSHVPDLKDHIKETSTYRSFMKEARAKKQGPNVFKRRFVPAFTMVTALFVIGLFIIAPFSAPSDGDTASTHIQIEINPSFGLDVDEDDTITGMNAYNSDAETLFDETGDLKGETLADGLDRLVGNAVDLGYLNENNHEILYTVSGEDSERVETKASELEEKLPQVAKAKGVSNAQAMRSVNGPPDQEELEEAREHNIGFMKMRLIKNILESTDEYTFETLKEENVGTLKDIIRDKDIEEHGPPFNDRGNMPDPTNRDDRGHPDDDTMPGNSENTLVGSIECCEPYPSSPGRRQRRTSGSCAVPLNRCRILPA